MLSGSNKVTGNSDPINIIHKNAKTNAESYVLYCENHHTNTGGKIKHDFYRERKRVHFSCIKFSQNIYK